MSFPRYPEYKHSGVEWLGEVPRHWDIDRIKRSTASCRNGIWERNHWAMPVIFLAYALPTSTGNDWSLNRATQQSVALR